MRVFRSTFRDSEGKTHETPRWYVELLDTKGRPRRVPGFTDKGATRELGAKLERLVELHGLNREPDAALRAWIETLAPRLRSKLARVGILDSQRLAAARPIAELLQDFKATLRTRERTESWIDHVFFRVRVTFEGAGFETLSDIDPAAIERHLHALRSGELKATDGALGRRRRKSLKDKRANKDKGEKAPEKPDPTLSSRESNHRIQACREFTRWAVASRLLSSDPLVSLAPMNAELDPRHTRRALRPEELRTLIAAAHNGKTHRGVSGEVRALVWRLAAQAGLRVGEIQALQVRHVDLSDAKAPTLTVSATISKNRTEACIPLAAELARDLAPWLRGKLPTATVLPLPPSFMHKAAGWLRVDLAVAQIPYRDPSDRVADVHSLRSSFVAELVRSGANVKAIQRLARHKSPMMTLGIYARLDARDERDAIDAFPSLAPAPTPREAMRATGTESQSHLACNSAEPCSSASSRLPSTASRIGLRAARKASGPVGMVAVEGFEPSAALAPESSRGAASETSSVETSATTVERLGVLLGILDQESPDVALVVRAWPTLAEPMRAAVLALVRASLGEAGVKH